MSMQSNGIRLRTVLQLLSFTIRRTTLMLRDSYRNLHYMYFNSVSSWILLLFGLKCTIFLVMAAFITSRCDSFSVQVTIQKKWRLDWSSGLRQWPAPSDYAAKSWCLLQFCFIKSKVDADFLHNLGFHYQHLQEHGVLFRVLFLSMGCTLINTSKEGGLALERVQEGSVNAAGSGLTE